jgi:hypothetical protein
MHARFSRTTKRHPGISISAVCQHNPYVLGVLYTNLHSMASCVLNYVNEHALEIMEDNEQRQKNLVPISGIGGCHLTMKFSKELAVIWLQKGIDGDLIQLCIHYWRDWDGTVPGVVGFRWWCTSKLVVATYCPRQFCEACTAPYIQGI